MYVEKLRIQGKPNPHYRSEKFKARILKVYPERVSFWHPKYCSETELVYCNEVSKGEIVESAVNVSNEDNMNVKEGNNTHDNYVCHAAKNVRNSLLNHKAVMPWLPYATDLKDENILLPNSV